MLNWFKKKRVQLPNRTLDEIKIVCNILFIDDRKFPVVDILNDAGWTNTRSVKDLDSLDQKEIREAHIIFSDIQGVGKKLKFSEEGLGLAEAIKQKYPTKKLIVYSAEEQGKIETFHPAFELADNRLNKNSDPYQFQILVEKYAKESFSFNECIERIQKQIQRETGYSVEFDEVVKSLVKIQGSKNFSNTNVARIFNLQNAAAIANIVQLFITGTTKP
ncbi:hypothetical protein [Reichenbachiella sp. MALMAid0571]|uniref:hypothetical protein n=1 Tax=Reichenbachiella sp. MALMAid0571 TaxID=3143939 RepID=UPI0032DE2CEF